MPPQTFNPLQNTGVPDALQLPNLSPQPAAPALNFNPVPSMPTQSADSLPAVLSALVGTIGGLGGAINGAGPAGLTALSLSQALQDHANAAQNRQYESQLQQSKLTGQENVANATVSRALQIQDPATRQAALAELSNRNVPGAEEMIRSERAQQKFDRTQNKDQARNDYLFLKSTGDTLQSQLDPSIEIRAQIAQGLVPRLDATDLGSSKQGQAQFAAKMAEFQDGLRKQGYKVSFNRQEMQGYQDEIRNAAIAQNDSPVGQFFGLMPNKLNSDKIGAALLSKIPPQALQQHADLKSQIAQINQLKSQVRTPGDQVQGQVQNILGTSQQNSNEAPLTPPAASGGTPETVRVIAPDGTAGSLPASKLQKALSSGYKRAK